jgi:hypothetical protein
MLETELRSRIDAVGEVLIERPGRARASFYAEVECPPDLPPGSLQKMRFTAVRGNRLVGEPLA